jgi:hypothetical protein
MQLVPRGREQEEEEEEEEEERSGRCGLVLNEVCILLFIFSERDRDRGRDRDSDCDTLDTLPDIDMGIDDIGMRNQMMDFNYLFVQSISMCESRNDRWSNVKS